MENRQRLIIFLTDEFILNACNDRVLHCTPVWIAAQATSDQTTLSPFVKSAEPSPELIHYRIVSIVTAFSAATTVDDEEDVAPTVGGGVRSGPRSGGARSPERAIAV
jgi:hypothetical protein